MNTYIQDKLNKEEMKELHQLLEEVNDMNYIQDKLLEKHICRFNDGECNCDCYIAGMQDYHNHIVEKIDDAIKNHQITNSYAEGILEGMMHCKHLILQDTNPKE